MSPEVVVGHSSKVLLLTDFTTQLDPSIDYDCTLVPLTPLAGVSPVLRHHETFRPTQLLTRTIHEELQDQVDSFWQTTLGLTTQDEARRDHFYYYALLILSPYFTWQRLIRGTLTVLQPSCVAIYSSSLDSAFPESVNSPSSKVVRTLLNASIANETQGLDASWFGPGQSKASIGTGVVAQKHGGASEKLAAAKDQFNRLKWARLQRGKVAMMVSQGRKGELLRAFLARDMRTSQLSYRDFERLFDARSLREESCFSLSASANIEHELRDHLVAARKLRELSPAEIEGFCERNWDLLITDAQHHSYMRQVVPKALDIGKQVAVIPEGAVGTAGDHNELGGDAHVIHDSRLIRCCSSDSLSHDWTTSRPSSQQRAVTTGFLGSEGTSLRKELPTRVRRWRLRTRMLEGDGINVLLDVSGFTGNELSYKLCQPSEMEIAMHLETLGLDLLRSGYSVYATGRNAVSLEYLVERFQGWSFVAFSNPSWFHALMEAEILVTFNSSIGWQSLAMCKPVVTWSVPGFESLNARALGHVPNHWYAHVESPGLVAEGVTDMLSLQNYRLRADDLSLCGAPVRGDPSSLSFLLSSLDGNRGF